MPDTVWHGQTTAAVVAAEQQLLQRQEWPSSMFVVLEQP